MSNPSAAELRALAVRLNTSVVHLHRQLRRSDASLDLPVAQASALALLVSAGPHTIGSLANFELVAAPTMTRIVSALETKGLVQRTRLHDDGRVVQVEATEAGRRLIQEAFSARLNRLAEGLAALTPAEQLQLEGAIGLLERLAPNPKS